MKVAVTAVGPSLDAALDPRFGRCSCFVVVDTDDMNFETIDNVNVSLGGGAGIQYAQLMADKGAQEAQALKVQAKDMMNHLRAIHKRISDIEGIGPDPSAPIDNGKIRRPVRNYQWLRKTTMGCWA
jgi:hypothetical protein